MRRRPAPCSTPRCPTLTLASHCPKHTRTNRRMQAQQRRAADDPSMNVYSTDAWRKAGPAFYRLHPRCQDCGAPATQRDHVPPRQILTALGVATPDHPRWLQPRCDSCHATKTATVDKPLLQRWRNGEDAQQLAEEAMRQSPKVG